MHMDRERYRLVHNTCLGCAAEIRATAMQRGADLDDEDRKGLFALATIIERKAAGMAAGRLQVERAVDGLIDLLDALDASEEDLEDGNDDELDHEGEATLGAPENHPLATADMDNRRIRAGSRDNRLGSQVNWGQGYNDFWADGELEVEPDLEPEAGYDLPEGDEEFDGPGEDAEPSLGAPNNHHNQTHWGQGCSSDRELVNEDGIAKDSDGIGWQVSQANVAAARDMERKAEAIRRRKRPCPTAGRDAVYQTLEPGLLQLVGVADFTAN